MEELSGCSAEVESAGGQNCEAETEQTRDVTNDANNNNNYIQDPQKTMQGSTEGVIEVPFVQPIARRRRFVEVPEVHKINKVQPRIQVQEVIRRIPQIQTVVRQKIVEIPEIRYIDKFVEVPQVHEVIRHVPKIEIREIIREVPREVIEYVDKIVEEPFIKWVDKIVEVPQEVEIIREVPQVQVIEIPVEKVKYVHKKEVKIVDKIRHVPGPIEYRDIPVEVPVPREVYDIIERIIEIPVEQEIVVEKEVAEVIPGEVVDVPFECIKTVDKFVTKDVPGKIIKKETPVIVEQIQEIEVPEYHEIIRVVPRERIVPVDVIHEIEVPEFIDEIVQVKKPVIVQDPPRIIRPCHMEVVNQLADIHEMASPIYVHEPCVELPPIYDPPAEPIVQDVRDIQRAIDSAAVEATLKSGPSTNFHVPPGRYQQASGVHIVSNGDHHGSNCSTLTPLRQANTTDSLRTSSSTDSTSKMTENPLKVPQCINKLRSAPVEVRACLTSPSTLIDHFKICYDDILYSDSKEKTCEVAAHSHNTYSATTTADLRSHNNDDTIAAFPLGIKFG